MAEPIDPRLVNLLGAASTAITDSIAGSLGAASDVDPAAAGALVALLDFTPAGTIARLSTALGLTHSGTVRLIDRLGTAGYVVRAAGTDARSVTISPTRTGRTLARRIRAARAGAIAAAVEDLTGAEAEALVGILEKVIGSTTRARLRLRSEGDAPRGGALCRMCDFAACGRPDGHCPAAQAAAARA